MTEIACECSDGLGVPHSHLFTAIEVEGRARYLPTREVRIWVDWKALARELCR